jgi:hypothetical protein
MHLKRAARGRLPAYHLGTFTVPMKVLIGLFTVNIRFGTAGVTTSAGAAAGVTGWGRDWQHPKIGSSMRTKGTGPGNSFGMKTLRCALCDISEP